LRLDELINQFLALSERIADAIISDERLEHVRQLDQQLSDAFEAILMHETKDNQEFQTKSHFLVDQIVDTEDLSRRQQLAEHLKKHSLNSKR